jgi:hypothetical protein
MSKSSSTKLLIIIRCELALIKKWNFMKTVGNIDVYNRTF